MKQCDLCGRERDDTDVATLYKGNGILYLCHGFLDASPTCYEKSEWELPHLAPDDVLPPLTYVEKDPDVS